jgi:branched-chain amino acid transport system substrate-binding protein
MRPVRVRRATSTRAIGLLVCLAVAAGCGTKLDHTEIVESATGTRVGTGTAAGPSVEGSTDGAVGSVNSGTSGSSGSEGAVPGAAGPQSQPGARATTGGGASGSPQAATGSEVVIGSVGTFSGVIGSFTAGAREAMLAWAQSVNGRGGLNGHPVRLLVADDGGDPARAQSIVRDMVERQGAIAFVGNQVVLTVSGVTAYLEGKGIPFIGGDLTTPTWTASPVLFPQGTDVDSVGAASLSELAKAGYTKIAVLFCTESPGCRRGGPLSNYPPNADVVYTADVSIAQPDYTGECIQAKNAGAQAMFLGLDGNSVHRVARSCAQQGYKPGYGTSTISVLPDLAADPNLEGLIAPTPNAPWFLTDTPALKQYAAAMAQYAPKVPLSAITSAQWASGILLERAAAKLSAKPTSAELLAALGAIRNETLGGLAPPLSFAAGRPSPRVPCYFVVRVKGGQWIAPKGSTPSC